MGVAPPPNTRLRPRGAKRSDRRGVVLLSDAFPSETAGGAEWSLTRALEHVDHTEFAVTVVTFSQRCRDVEREHRGEITVLRVPAAFHWARVVLARGRPNTARRARSSLLNKSLAGAHYATSARLTSDRRERAKKLALFYDLDARDRTEWTPCHDRDVIELQGILKTLNRILRDHQPDIVHADNLYSILVASLAERGRARFVAQVRDNRFLCMKSGQDTHVEGAACDTCRFQCLSAHPNATAQQLAKFMEDDRRLRLGALAAADAVIVSSQYLRDQIRAAAFGAPVHVVVNPIDDVGQVDAWRSGVARADPAEILIAGLVDRRKGHHRIVDLIKRLRTHSSRFKVVVAGAGPLLADLRAQVTAQNLEPWISLTGHVEREALFRLYARASVALMPHRWPEPFGRAALEAGVSRRPVVAYRLGGVSDSVVHGVTGFLAPPQDEERLTAYVAELLANPELAARMGDAAFRVVTERFDAAQAAEQMSAVWRGRDSA